MALPELLDLVKCLLKMAVKKKMQRNLKTKLYASVVKKGRALRGLFLSGIRISN